MQAAGINLIGVLGPAIRVTVWRRLRRVVMYYATGRRSVHTNVPWTAVNALERHLAEGGWHMKIDNLCRSEWTH